MQLVSDVLKFHVADHDMVLSGSATGIMVPVCLLSHPETKWAGLRRPIYSATFVRLRNPCGRRRRTSGALLGMN